MGLIDHLSKNPNRSALPASNYDKDFVVVNIRAIISKLENAQRIGQSERSGKNFD